MVPTDMPNLVKLFDGYTVYTVESNSPDEDEEEDRLAWSLLAFSDKCDVYLTFNRTVITVSVRDIDGSHFRAIADSLHGIMANKPKEEGTNVHFWFASDRGYSAKDRVIKCNSWADIKENYTNNVVNAVQPIMEGTIDNSSGRIILFFGEPGTGKTHLIRSLAASLKDTDIEYIMDSERFFHEAAYMMQVVMGEHYPNKSKKLIVIEDSSELIREDAREVAGQSLSRLLNLTDGM